MHAIEGEYNITNQPAVIPVGVSEACFQLVAIDDHVVENHEEFTLVVEATYSNDVVIGNATFIIADNDGMIRCWVLCMTLNINNILL